MRPVIGTVIDSQSRWGSISIRFHSIGRTEHINCSSITPTSSLHTHYFHTHRYHHRSFVSFLSVSPPPIRSMSTFSSTSSLILPISSLTAPQLIDLLQSDSAESIQIIDVRDEDRVVNTYTQPNYKHEYMDVCFLICTLSNIN